MKRRPILFSAQMVAAILQVRKTQTRRIIKLGSQFQESDTPGYDWTFRGTLRGGKNCGTWQDLRTAELLALCPYGQPGDRLWIKTGYATRYDPERNETHWTAEGLWDTTHGRAYSKSGNAKKDGKHPGMFMPAWLSAEWYPDLEVVAVRAERLHAITEADAVIEGFGPGFVPAPHAQYADVQTTVCVGHRPLFVKLWDKLNGKSKPWASDPPVWVISFAVLKDTLKARRNCEPRKQQVE